MKDYSVIDLLENYRINQSKLKLIGYKGKANKELNDLKEKYEKLTFCVNCLPEEDKQLLTQIYFDGISIRNISKMGIMSRSSVVRRRDKAIKLLENLVKTLEN